MEIPDNYRNAVYFEISRKVQIIISYGKGEEHLKKTGNFDGKKSEWVGWLLQKRLLSQKPDINNSEQLR